MDKFIANSEHHVVLTKDVGNNLTKAFDKIAETDKDFKKAWNYRKRSRNFFMHINANEELSAEDAQQIADCMKETYMLAKKENHEDYQRRKMAKQEALKDAKKTNTSAN